jgi:hypothetical protein
MKDVYVTSTTFFHHIVFHYLLFNITFASLYYDVFNQCTVCICIWSFELTNWTRAFYIVFGLSVNRVFVCGAQNG